MHENGESRLVAFPVGVVTEIRKSVTWELDMDAIATMKPAHSGHVSDDPAFTKPVTLEGNSELAGLPGFGYEYRGQWCDQPYRSCLAHIQKYRNDTISTRRVV